MPQSSFLSQFPDELVDELAGCCDPGQLRTLCLVSRQWGNAATRYLYRGITLKDAKQAMQCFRTLGTKQEVASCVKWIVIDCPQRTVLGSFYRLAVAALSRTVNIIMLDISRCNALLERLVGLPFPHLRDARIPYTRALGPFLLQQKDTLQMIFVQPPRSPKQTKELVPHLRPIELTELVKFAGPRTVVPFVLPRSQVQHLTVWWEPGCEQHEEIMKDVVLSRSEIVEMDNFYAGWNPMLLGMFGTYIPRMQSLRVRIVCSSVTREMMEAYLGGLEQGLAKFERLHTLQLILLSQPAFIYEQADLFFEHRTIQQWGSLMPTLRVCVLPSTTAWNRQEGNTWIGYKQAPFYG